MNRHSRSFLNDMIYYEYHFTMYFSNYFRKKFRLLVRRQLIKRQCRLLTYVMNQIIKRKQVVHRKLKYNNLTSVGNFTI